MRHAALVGVRPLPHHLARRLVDDVHRVDVARVDQDVARAEALVARVEPLVLRQRRDRVHVQPIVRRCGRRKPVQIEMLVGMPLPDHLTRQIHLVDVGAVLMLFAASLARLPPGTYVHVLDLRLEFVGDRLMRDEQPIVVGQPAQVVGRPGALVPPDLVAVPVVLVDRAVRPGIQQVAARQQAAALVEVRRHGPAMHDVAVHVDQPDVVGHLPLGPDRRRRVVPLIVVIRDQDVAAVGLVGLVDRRPRRKDGGVGDHHHRRHRHEEPCRSRCRRLAERRSHAPYPFVSMSDDD